MMDGYVIIDPMSDGGNRTHRQTTKYRSLINYGGIKFYIDDNVNKNKKLMHQTNETQATILKSLVRTFTLLSFCGYNVFGCIIYHLCNPFFEVLKFLQKHRTLVESYRLSRIC